jgi:hypothetical protein
MFFRYEVEIVETCYGAELEITNYDGEIIGYAKGVNEAEKIINADAEEKRISSYKINYNI